jgi:ArsR family transcriptional regulator
MNEPRPARAPQPPVYQAKAEFFRILGHPVRVRTLELLRDGERTVGDLQGALGLDSSGTSQHLGVLRKHGVLDSRREGTSVYYRIKDPRMLQLLEVARQILTTNLTESQALLGQLADTAPPVAP